MKWIPKYQKTGKLNFKTTGLPWQQSKQDQEITRNTQSRGILNPTNLKNRLQPATKNLKAKYNNLPIKERLALAKRSMPHSEIVTVKDQYGNTKTSTNPQAGAMSGADEVPEGANLSTWGSVSKGGIHGINRFGKDFGFIQNGTRQLTMKGTKEPIEVGIFQKPKLDQGMVRLYRASGTNGKFTPSPDGTAKYTGMWFTDNPRKTLIYASNTRRKAIKEGVDNPIELQYIDIPKTQLNQYKASNIIGNDPNIEYEINEDFLIPLNMKRNRIPLKGITGNILRDSRLTIPKLDPNVFKIAAPIGMSLPFLNNSQK